MIHLDLVACLASFTLCLLLYLKQFKKYSKHALPLPPGPKGIPLIGNLLDIPKTFEWETYHKWCKEFNSDIIHLNVAGTSVLVLDTTEVAMELLERRSSIYSGRPRMPMLTELMGWDFSLGLLAYGDTWRYHRKLVHHAFHPVAAQEFQPIERRAAHGFLRRLLNDPTNFISHARHMASETVISVAYGIEVPSKDNPYIRISEEATGPLFKAMRPGTFLVDSLPALKHIPDWMPFAAFKRKANEWKKLTLRMVEIPFKAAKREIANGNSTVSLVSVALQGTQNHDVIDQESAIKHVAGSLYAAGSDSTLSAILTCILALVVYPEVMKKAHQELDSIVGRDRLPDFEDRNSLPYITAIVKESLRWQGVAPLGVPHFLRVDDEYRGYRLPAGSTVISNIWAMLHDDDVYPNPFEFNPDRFMKDGMINTVVKDPANTAFGFGRRICPARYMASSAIWIALASLIAMFDITKAMDENGVPIEPSQEYSSGLVSTPLPFKCLIKPRSKEAEALILSTSDN